MTPEEDALAKVVGLLEDIGVDAKRFYKAIEPDWQLYQDMGLRRGVFFDKSLQRQHFQHSVALRIQFNNALDKLIELCCI